MRVDARQARCPPAGAPHASFSSPFPQSPPPLPPGPERPRPSRVGCTRPDTTAPRQGRPRRRFPLPPGSMAALPLPSTSMDAGRSGSAGDGAGDVGRSAPPAAASHPWTGGAGRGLARRGRRRASGAVGGYVKPRMNGEQRCAIPGGSRGAAEAHASGARLAGPEGVEGVGGCGAGATGGPGAGAGSTGEGLPECFARAGPPSRRRGAGP